jgi:tetratricopeptide (TPR) repeat protein
VDLDAEALARLLEQLEVVGTPWAAFEALDELEALELAGDQAGALAMSERLRDLAPGWDVGRRRRLNLLMHGLRDADAASADLDSLPEGTLPPDEIRRNRQTIALLRDDWATYAQYASARVEGGEREPWAWETLGLAWWAAGRLDLSLEALREGLALHQGNRDLELRVAEVLEAQGRHAEALAHLDALAGGPPHAKTLALRGWFRRLEAPDLASADYAAALALDAEQPVARVGRGLMRLEAGDREGARADLQPFTHCGWTEAAEAWRRYQAGEPG